MTAPSSMQLGETTDPTKLVPGHVGQVRANVSALEDEQVRTSRIQCEYSAITVPGWEGGYGEPAYQAKFEADRKKWSAYVDLLGTASRTLSAYADALGAAQDKAQDAIDKWEAGEKATADAVATYNAAVEAYNDSVCAPARAQSPFGPVVPQIRPAPPGPFHDPGKAIREAAQQILEDARTALDEAGQRAIVELGGLDGSKTEGHDDWFGAGGELHGPKFSWKFWEETFGTKPNKDEHDDDFVLSLGSAEGEVYVYNAEGTWEDYYGDFHVNADGTISIVKAEGELHGEYGYAEGSLHGSGLVGATGAGHVVVGNEGVHAGGELFAGGKIEGTAEGDVGGVGGSFTAGAWAGAGIGGDVDFGFHDGALTMGGKGGIAWGLGGSVGGEVTLDFPEMWETGGDIVSHISDFLP